MKELYSNDPIIACSTGRNTNTAIAVIRLSGFLELSKFSSSFSIDLENIEPNKALVSDLIFKGEVLDNIVMVFYKGPKSYNGENILELSVHGNQINIQNILQHFIEIYNFRIAKEGEFTYRALKNKKLSLTEVEGLDLLLNANSSLIFSSGMETLHGNLHKEYSKLRATYLMLKSSVELSIDFSDDVGDEQSQKLFHDYCAEFTLILENLYQRIQGDLNSLVCPEIALVGKTNAGKSSIFNKLLKVNRSIVSDIAGTTRDYISENIFVKGTSYKLIDTAGIRETSDKIEEIGIARALGILETSFYKVLVINPHDDDLSEYELLNDYIFDLVLFTHRDIKDSFKFNNLIKVLPKFRKYLYLDVFDNGPIEPMSGTKKNGPIEPKLGPKKTGPIEPESLVGINFITCFNQEISHKYQKLHASKPILIDRHRQLINEIYLKWQGFLATSSSEEDIAVISSELSLIESDLGELIGIIHSDHVLNNLFSNFCIGK